MRVERKANKCLHRSFFLFFSSAFDRYSFSFFFLFLIFQVLQFIVRSHCPIELSTQTSSYLRIIIWLLTSYKIKQNNVSYFRREWVVDFYKLERVIFFFFSRSFLNTETFSFHIITNELLWEKKGRNEDSQGKRSST